MIYITDENAFYLRVAAQTKAGSQMADVDLSQIKWLVASFVRRGRSLQTMEIDSQGRALIYNSGDLAMGVYGVEFNGYYNGQPWRFYEKNVFAIVDQTANAVEPSGEISGIPVFDVTVTITLGGEGVPESYVTNAINEHDNDMNAHPYLQERIENAGKVDDVKINGTSIVDNNKVANIDANQFGKVDDVKVNGQTVVNNKIAAITVPTKTSDLQNDSDFITDTEAEALVDEVKINAASVEYEEDGGEPDADVSLENNELSFQLKNMKMKFADLTAEEKAQITGPQGPQGDSAVYNPDDPDTPDFEMANTTGQSTTKAMTQKAVSDELDKKIEPTVGNTEHDLDISDLYGNTIASFLNGHLETKECTYVENMSSDGIFIADNNGYIFGWLINGHFISKNCNTTTKEEFYSIQKPTAAIDVYNVCNDLDKTNKWGINSRNYGLSVYLDHFISPQAREMKAQFDVNGKTYVSLSQSIVGNSETWNDGEALLSTSKTYSLNKEKTEIQIVNRQVLNSATQSLFPKVLQIGDSVTEGWFANYPTMAATPSASWQWAKYFFAKDKEQKGTGYDSLFLGTLNKVDITYDDVQVTGYAEGRGGWSPQTYWGSSSSGGKNNPFYDSSLQHFSLSSYLAKYKTLADDGVTRLVVGSTAGTSVTNVNSYDVCTPNIVVIQLGMNGTAAIYSEYVTLMVQQIKSEYPDMKIILSCLDAALCMFPSLYPEYDNIFLTDYDSAHKRMINIMKWVKDTLPTLTYTANSVDYDMTEENGIYGIYTGAVMPMPYSCNVREITNPLSVLQEGLKRYVGVDAIERVKHPSRFAHMAVGYELYSAIKWVLLSNI